MAQVLLLSKWMGILNFISSHRSLKDPTIPTKVKVCEKYEEFIILLLVYKCVNLSIFVGDSPYVIYYIEYIDEFSQKQFHGF